MAKCFKIDVLSGLKILNLLPGPGLTVSSLGYQAEKMNHSRVEVPRYILNLDHAPMRPMLDRPLQSQAVTVIYGFSTKSKYDSFLLTCAKKEELTPYPLVKGYMEKLLNTEPNSLHLVAVDAASADQATLDAATMQSIVSALTNRQPDVLISHALSRDASNTVYSLEGSLNEPTFGHLK